VVTYVRNAVFRQNVKGLMVPEVLAVDTAAQPALYCPRGQAMAVLSRVFVILLLHDTKGQEHLSKFAAPYAQHVGYSGQGAEGPEVNPRGFPRVPVDDLLDVDLAGEQRRAGLPQFLGSRGED